MQISELPSAYSLGYVATGKGYFLFKKQLRVTLKLFLLVIQPISLPNAGCVVSRSDSCSQAIPPG